MLLDKLSEKLSRKSALTDETQALLNNVKISNKNKIVKKIATLMLAGAMALAPIGIAACTANCGVIKNPTEQTQPNTPGGNTGTNPGGNTGGNKEEVAHSKIMDKLVQDDYYQDLVTQVWDNNLNIKNNMKPIPYRFLREYGHDVSAYLDGTLDAFASSYIYDNDKNHIYVSVKAENVSTHQYGNYYTNYVLKYPLTDQEYEEYTYLCEDEYLQGLLFIQELDNQKTPEVINKVNVQKESYNKMITQYTKSKNINFKNYTKIDMDIFTFNENEIEISIRNGSNSNMISNNIGYIKLIPNPTSAGVGYYDNDVMKLGNAAKVNYKNLDEYQSSLQNITSFGYGTNIKYTNPYQNDYIK